MAELNERIKIARTMAGLSQDYVAKELGVMQSVVTRYEKERRPPDASLRKLAELTGFPMEWFWLQPVKGLLTMRPERPGVSYSNPQVRMKEHALDRDFPQFIENLSITKLLLLKCRLGGIVIAHSDNVCAVIIGTHCIETIERISKGITGLYQSIKDCEVEDFLNCWMQPEFIYLKKILEYGGKSLLFWSKPIKEGKPGSITAKYHLEADFFRLSPDLSDKEKIMYESSHLLYITNILAEHNIILENATIKSTTAIIAGSPSNWHFIDRHGFPPKIPDGAIYIGPKDDSDECINEWIKNNGR